MQYKFLTENPSQTDYVICQEKKGVEYWAGFNWGCPVAFLQHSLQARCVLSCTRRAHLFQLIPEVPWQLWVTFSFSPEYPKASKALPARCGHPGWSLCVGPVWSLWGLEFVVFITIQLAFEQHGSELHGSCLHGYFSRNICTVVDLQLGFWMWEAYCLHWSTVFYTGDLASANSGTCGGPGAHPLLIPRENLSSVGVKRFSTAQGIDAWSPTPCCSRVNCPLFSSSSNKILTSFESKKGNCCFVT